MTPAPRRGAARAVFLALLVLWAGAVWALSAAPHPEELVGFRLRAPDWAAHGMEFAVGGFLAGGALRRDGRAATVVLSVAFCGLWGVLDEFHQSFVPGRDPSGTDLAADLVGAAAGAFLFVLGPGRVPAGTERTGAASPEDR